MEYTLEHIRKNSYIIFESIMGSKAYGTDTPESDTDIRGIFIQPYEDIIKYGFIEQVSDELNDIVFYELKRFLELAVKNNPNILELLNAPEDMVIYKHPIYDVLYNNRKDFLSKECKHSFGGYALSQIKKAKGYNKMINWEQDKVTRKSIIDFCYILSEDGKTFKFHKWLENFNINFNQNNPTADFEFTQKHFGLSKVNNARDVYAMHDVSTEDEWDGESYYGGVYKNERSNEVKLTSFSKEAKFIKYLIFNKDAWSSHCKDYSNYQTWIEKRNKNRFKMNKEHGKQYDSKNIMHTFRLLNMAIEIGKGEDIRVKRTKEEIEYLMSIRRGELEYDDILNRVDILSNELEEAFENSNLPDKTNRRKIQDMELQIRTKFY